MRIDRNPEIEEKLPMGLKIKWNDDRVRDATTALLLISRARLSDGARDSEDLTRSSLAYYRTNPDSYKNDKVRWADADQLGPLTNPKQIVYYQKLRSTVERALLTMAARKHQFNSLIELDNFLIFTMRNVR